MALTPGSRIGSYEIAGEIGAGGMGVVYRATDTNLKRDVAIKVLPESLAGDEERLTRFQREAELLASLNHPNIAQIYGLERSEGTTALIMELVEGPKRAGKGAPRDMDITEFFREWQAPCAGLLFIVMGAGNFRATIQTYMNKRRYAKKAKMA